MNVICHCNHGWAESVALVDVTGHGWVQCYERNLLDGRRTKYMYI